MGVHVDVTRCDDVAFRRDGALAGLRTDLTDADNLAVFDSDVAVKLGITRAIDHPAAVDHDIELSHFSLLFRLFFVAISSRPAPDKESAAAQLSTPRLRETDPYGVC